MPSLPERIEEFLDTHHVMTLATVAAAGAHAASLLYARKGFELYWTSDPQTRHSRHIERDPRVTATIAPDTADFRAIRGLQIAGRAARIADAQAVAEARALLARRYAFLAELAAAPALLRSAFEKACFYRLLPQAITLIDNNLGFGHKETLKLP